MEPQYSQQHIEMALLRDHLRRVENPDGYGKNTGDCRDTVEFFLLVDQDRIRDIFFQTNGCINTTVCSNTVAELAKGKRLEEAWQITPEEVIIYLQTLPEDHHHCAELAVGALYRALTDLRANVNKPWRKLYRAQRE
jgi:nitrogen fixation protein NifU and related proteins